MTATEANKRLRAIARARSRIESLETQIRRLEHELKVAVVKAFNDMSGPLSGITVDEDELCLGSNECTMCPAQVCVYSQNAVSLPSQRRLNTDANTDPLTIHTTECLFCGVEDEHIW
jgi:formate hydrogenlyase subunit 6/NADH:ubiquinone oxidoreductase subunit I